MWRKHWMLSLAVLTAAVVGCGGSSESGQDEGTEQGTAAAGSDPAAAVFAFLEAVRTGDDETAHNMLSSVAQRKTAQLNRRVTPPASDTARFEIGEVEYVADDGARVACTWTDLDADRQPRSDHAKWMVRREPQGWRIVGVAYTVFKGELPLLLNFEDPEDMLEKQQWVRDEIQRRAENESSQAARPENSQNSARR